jgi:ankyrin repeat protein
MTLKKMLLICMINSLINAGNFRSIIENFCLNFKIKNFWFIRPNYFEIIDQNNYERCRYDIINQRFNPNLPLNDQGTTALMLAVRKGNLQMIQLFVQNSDDINQKDTSGRSALWYAVAEHEDQNALDIVGYLLKNGADPATKGCMLDEKSPFLLALKIKSFFTLQKMLKFSKLDDQAISMINKSMPNHNALISQNFELSRSKSSESINTLSHGTTEKLTTGHLDLALTTKLLKMRRPISNSSSKASLVLLNSPKSFPTSVSSSDSNLSTLSNLESDDDFEQI